jgi:hypothetical protein
MQLPLAILLALVPLAWMIRHRGRRHVAREGNADGMLLLASLVCTLISLVSATVSASRSVAERRRYASSREVQATVQGCHVAARHSGGRNAVRSHELQCDVTYMQDARRSSATVLAGYPSRRDAYDAWVASHPPGSTVVLRQSTAGDPTPWGLERMVPSTTQASDAARTALIAGLLACILLVASRIVARRAPTA